MAILAPLPSLIALDGLGLLGPPLPGLSTGSPTPTWSLTVPNFPVLGGQTFAFQVYAIDSSLAPSLTSLLITNSVQLTINGVVGRDRIGHSLLFPPCSAGHDSLHVVIE